MCLPENFLEGNFIFLKGYNWPRLKQFPNSSISLLEMIFSDI